MFVNFMTYEFLKNGIIVTGAKQALTRSVSHTFSHCHSLTPTLFISIQYELYRSLLILLHAIV